MPSFQEALKAGQTSPDNAWAIFDSLPAVSVDFMLGLWRASGFPTGHPQDGKLERLGWYGKRFTDENSVDPMIFNSQNDEVFSADPVYIIRNLDVLRHACDVRDEAETKEPKARLRLVEARGTLTASMVYNNLPIIDHFRKLNEDTVLGMMEKPTGQSHNYFFVLRRTRDNNSSASGAHL